MQINHPTLTSKIDQAITNPLAAYPVIKRSSALKAPKQLFFMRNLLLILISLVVVIACDDESVNPASFKDDFAIASLSGTWKVVSYEDYSSNTIITKTDENSWNGADVIINLNDKTNPPQIWGVNTTNQISGTYQYDPIIRSIKIPALTSTEVNQPEWGNLFTKGIHQVNTYKINEKQLRLYYNNSNNSITLVKQ